MVLDQGGMISVAREPWWVKRARYLKREAKPRWKVEDIAVELGRSVPDVRKALGIPQQYSVPIEPLREDAPEWAERARKMVQRGASIQHAADELGLPYSRVYRELHYRRKAAADRRHRPSYRDRDAELKRERNRRKAAVCERCGSNVSSVKVSSALCQDCREELWQQKMELAAELRRAGWRNKEVAERVGVPTSSVSALLNFARKRGLEVPHMSTAGVLLGQGDGRPAAPRVLEMEDGWCAVCEWCAYRQRKAGSAARAEAALREHEHTVGHRRARRRWQLKQEEGAS